MGTSQATPATPSEPSRPYRSAIFPCEPTEIGPAATANSKQQAPHEVRGETGPRANKLSSNSEQTRVRNIAITNLDSLICQKLTTLASKHVPCLRRVPTRPKPNGAAGLSPSARPDYIVPGTPFFSPKTFQKLCTIPLPALDFVTNAHHPPRRRTAVFNVS